MGLKDGFNEKKEQLSQKIDDAKDYISEEYSDAKDAISDTVDTGVKKTKSFFKWLLISVLIAAVVGTILFFLYANYTYSKGSRTGQLVKVSEKGYVFKTFEGQLNMGGISGNISDGTLGTVWEFSLRNKDLYKELESLEGKKVFLRYREINKAMPWQGDTNYIVYEVEVRE